MKSKSKNYKIWFFSEKPLDQLAKTLFKNEIIGDFEYDYENVYEWVEAQTAESSVGFNISRKHCFLQDEDAKNELNSNITEPITLMLMYDNSEPSDETIENIANRINVALKITVYLGNVNYMGGDDYEYITTKEVS